MTHGLSLRSPRHAAAVGFGLELKRAMTTRKIGAHRLADATGVAYSAIDNWKRGGNLPRLETAIKLADVLAWPGLADIVRNGRTLRCAQCKRPFVFEGGRAAKYCSPACQRVNEQLRAPSSGQVLATWLRETLYFRAGIPGGIPKTDLEQALGIYNRSDAKRTARIDQQLEAIDQLRNAVGAMCRQCEPEGLCRDADCPLRPVSPLPVAQEIDGRFTEIGPAEGAWGPTNRAKRLEQHREQLRERWARPGERERHSEMMRERHAALTPEQRRANVQPMLDGQQLGREAAAE